MSTLSFDIDQALRRLKPQKRVRRLRRRSDSQLRWASDEPLLGRKLILDTTVYIDILQGRTSPPLDRLLAYRVCHHSAVCLAELTHIFGRLDPAHPATPSALRAVARSIEGIPGHRRHAPETMAWRQAGMPAGEFARLCACPKGAGLERKALNDSLIYVQARLLGASLLTGNIADFDVLNQPDPGVDIISYRRPAPEL